MLKQKKEEGNVAFKAERYQEAYNLYTEALLVDPQNTKTNAKLHFNKATVAAKVRYLNKTAYLIISKINKLTILFSLHS